MTSRKFIDLFAGCGGFSLGLTQAGLEGAFAIERDAMAFSTLAANLAHDECSQVEQFRWPEWLPKEPMAIEKLLDSHLPELIALRGHIDVIAGGPPCQGFSYTGRRRADDPRNLLFEKYAEVVEAVRPAAVVLENVPGMKVAHGNKAALPTGSPWTLAADDSYYDRLVNRLQEAGYTVEGRLLDAMSFGVPQRRRRLIVIGIRNDLAAFLAGGTPRVFDAISEVRLRQLQELGLSQRGTARDALCDLETGSQTTRTYRDPAARGTFSELKYQGPITAYQRCMRLPFPPAAMDSMRLARHSPEVRGRFARIIAECEQGVRMNEDDRARFGLKKYRIHPMHEDQPAPTITTLPDDVLHYSEPRILTVRECARIQSFPDWFEFRGKYTTGGTLRTKECPRYTQVGNAVPPLMARALGTALRLVLGEIDAEKTSGATIDRFQEAAAIERRLPMAAQ